MAIEFVGYAGGTNGTSAKSQSLTALTGGISAAAAAGDYIVALYSTYLSSTTASSNPPGPGSFSSAGGTAFTALHTAIEGYGSYSSNDGTWYDLLSVRAMGYRLTAADASMTVNSAGGSGGRYIIAVFRGVHPTTPMDVTPTTSGTSSSAIDAPSITPVTAGAWIVATGGSTVGFTPSLPAGMSNLYYANGSNHTVAMALKMDWTSGAFNPPTFGSSSGAEYRGAITIALRPDPNYSAGGQPKVWTGSAWTAKPLKYWNGLAWVTKPLKVWNGSAWVNV